MSGKGKKEYQHGIPFVEVEGSYYDMGVQYGTLLREEVRSITGKLAVYLRQYQQVLPRPQRWLFPVFLSLRLRQLASKLPERYREELRGVAEAAGVGMDKLLFGAFGAELIGACSTVLARHGNRFVMGRNLDYWPPFLGEHPCVVRCFPTGKRPFVSMGIAGFLGCLTAINDRGLMVSVNKIITAPGTKTNRFRDRPVGYALRDVVEQAQSLQEAEKIVRDYRPYGGWIITVGSRSEIDGVAFELAGDILHRRGLDRQGHLYSTNFFVNEELSRKYTSFLYARSPMNLARMNQIKDFMSANPRPDCERMISLLASMNFHGREVMGAKTPVVNNIATLQCIVIDGEDIYFAAAPACSGAANWLKFKSGDMKAELDRQGRVDVLANAAAFSRWQEQVRICLAKKDYEGVLDHTPLRPGNLTMTGAVVDAWRRGKVNSEAMLELLAQETSQWPDYALLSVWRGEVLLKLNRLVEAAEALEAALRADVCYPTQRLFCYRFLAEAWLKQGNRELAGQCRDKCLALLNSHVSGKAEKQLRTDLAKVFRTS